MARPKKLPKFVKLVKPKKEVKPLFDVKGFAEVAAKTAADKNGIGAFIESIVEDDVTTYFWEAKQPGYGGWRWAVSVYQLDPATEPTVSEVLLLPGTDSLIAPKWVPWKDRLADYQALQAELAKQAELEKEENAEEPSEEDSDELAVLDLEEGEDPEDKTN